MSDTFCGNDSCGSYSDTTVDYENNNCCFITDVTLCDDYKEHSDSDSESDCDQEVMEI